MMGSHIMKTSSIFAFVVFAASTSLLSAAPAVSTTDLSVSSLKDVATPTQKKSIKEYEDTKAKAVADREQEIAESKKITENNDAGTLKTIQKRTLNNMLPACEREPEAPRKPDLYEVR